MRLGLLLGMVLQQPQIQVTVDRTDVEVGDEIVVTVKVTSPGGCRRNPIPLRLPGWISSEPVSPPCSRPGTAWACGRRRGNIDFVPRRPAAR